MPAKTVTLTSGADSVSFLATSPDTEAPISVPGVVHRTAGGGLIRYQTGVAYFETTLNIQSITTAQKESLEAFFRSHWKDSLTYTDENSNTFTASFLDSALKIRKQYRNCWSAAIRLDLSSCLK